MSSHEPSWWLGGAWGAVFAACLGAVYIGLALGGQGDTVLLGITALAGLLLVAAERVRPRERGWREADGQWWQDLGHFVASFGVGSFTGAWLAGVTVPAPLVTIWPTAWPMAVQAVLGLVVAEFFGYWQHRVLHTVPWLWPLHALHHSTSRMTFFKATRIHALDIGSFTFVSVAPLLALGASAEVVLWVTAFGNFAAQTQHTNIALPTPPWLNAVVGTPSVHWLHHSLDLREGNSNFGMNLMLFDHLFGTYMPPSPEPPAAFGIQPDFVPRGFLGQLALPLESIRRLVRREP